MGGLGSQGEERAWGWSERKGVGMYKKNKGGETCGDKVCEEEREKGGKVLEAREKDGRARGGGTVRIMSERFGW